MSDFIPKKILITSARSPVALSLARLFHAAGHTVYVAETMRLHLCRFSNAVSKCFIVPSPRKNIKGFVDQLITIVHEEGIDLIVPIYEEAIYLSKEKHRFPTYCQIFTSSFALVHELHNKWQFIRKLEHLGITTPKTFLIKSQNDLGQLDNSCSYAFKPCYSRASLNLLKVSPGKPLPNVDIEPHNPWVAQEWIDGKQFCSYSVCRNGFVQAHTAYPYGFTADEKGCIVFKAIDHPAIYKWVEKFVKLTNFTGQIAFDFIQAPDDTLYAIECNPRATNGALLFEEKDRLDRAFLENECPPIFPKEGAGKQLAIAMLMYGWRKSSHPDNSMKRFLNEFMGTKDAIFNKQDSMPFLCQPLTMSEIWLASLKTNLSLPAFFVFDYEWNAKHREGISSEIK